MAPGSVDPFERLPEDLVCNILERVLWRPFEFGNVKARNKLLLGLVCKQFKRIIPELANLRNLEWEINGAEDKDKLLEHLSNRKGGLRIKRLVLHLRFRADPLEISQAVLLIARDTLEEIYLYIGEEVLYRFFDWHGILSILQQCKRLSVLHFTLWRAFFPLCFHPVLLEFAKPLNPFHALRSLTLYGFYLRGQTTGALSRTFPVLDYLEISHSYVTDVYDLGLIPAQKIYWWGVRGAKVDVKAPSLATVPRSLDMMFGFLCAGGWLENNSVKTGILIKLRELTIDVANQKAIGHLAGIFETLMGFVQFSEGVADPPLSRVHAFVILHNLASLPENRKAIVDVPGCLSLIKVLLNDNIEDGGDSRIMEVAYMVAMLLNKLTTDPDIAKSVAKLAGMLGVLVTALGVDYLSHPVAEVLSNVTREDPGSLRFLGRSRTTWKRLTELSDPEKCLRAQEAAASILSHLHELEQDEHKQ